MIGELVARFLIGGTLVSLFAVLGDLFEPKSFGGLFGAAPSVALATLALSIRAHGPAYGSVEARSMVIGAIALLASSSAISGSLAWWRAPMSRKISAALGIWFAVAFAGWALLLRGR